MLQKNPHDQEINQYTCGVSDMSIVPHQRLGRYRKIYFTEI